MFISSSSVMLAGRLATARQKSTASRVQLGPLAPAFQVPPAGPVSVAGRCRAGLAPPACTRPLRHEGTVSAARLAQSVAPGHG